MNKGVWYAIGAYALWGLFPLFWKQLEYIPALELIAHRFAWSFVLLALVLLLTRQTQAFRAQVQKRHVLVTYSISALLIGTNWLIYVWAVNAGYVVEASLGYFINPLVSVLLGVIFLRERLRPLQWLPIGLVALGVVFLTFAYGSLPWIAISLACSFGVYGLVKKTAPLGSLYGLSLETGLMFLPALGYLLFVGGSGQGAFLRSVWWVNLMLASAGIITVVPLLMFSSAARLIPLSVVGILQYITPTMQFLLGIFVYREPFTSAQLLGFSIVWVALILYSSEALFNHHARQEAPAIAD